MNSEARMAASYIRVQSVRKVLLGMGQRTARDPAVGIEDLEEEGRLRTPGARTRAVRS